MLGTSANVAAVDLVPAISNFRFVYRFDNDATIADASGATVSNMLQY